MCSSVTSGRRLGAQRRAVPGWLATRPGVTELHTKQVRGAVEVRRVQFGNQRPAAR
ncbi:MAG TPA: hypothetical protein VK735_48345 [Pseudonocardia sp.]|uniref:hypothetical protein n=1 Tax=Pseudonocardia sp. TaxID=60912 RepID=UPI002C57572A|nr:hypothetical protein [Pseudonocardia sp.]HTF55307.1 hypothetical protein [Pseudonocardia sp.]